MSDLLSPGRIGPVELRNRVVMPSMTTRAADEDGFVTPDTLAYYAARAAGGVGLVTVEMAAPEKVGKHRHRELGIYYDRFLPGLEALVAAIHGHGAKAAIQLGHGGGHTRADIMGEAPIAPSAIPHPVQEITFATVVPVEMTADRIEQTIRAFVAAAERARAAGFDAVEIHAAHGYLVSQFLCPFENRRTDDFGGSLANRARFALAITRRIKAALPDRAVIFRLNGDDLFPEGMPFAEARQVAVWAAEAGADAIHVTGGHYRSKPSAALMIPPMAIPEAPFLDWAAAIKALVNVPVIAVGRLGDPAVARAAIADGKADFVALGRPLLADPDWVRKVEADEPVRRCLACNHCVDGMRGGAGLRCLVNPTTGRERRFAMGSDAAPSGERIAVVGGGPAGLAYASLAAERNVVTVIERSLRFGGAWRRAAKAPVFENVEPLAKSLSDHVEALVEACAAKGVMFRMGVDALAHPSHLLPFDRIVVATGARYPVVLGALLSLLLRLPRAWLRPLAERPVVRDWLYRRGRRPTGEPFRAVLRDGQKLDLIGDARVPDKSAAAIRSAFAAALLGDPAALEDERAEERQA